MRQNGSADGGSRDCFGAVRKPGFSLPEVAVVLAMMAVVLSIALHRFSALRDATSVRSATGPRTAREDGPGSEPDPGLVKADVR